MHRYAPTLYVHTCIPKNHSFFGGMPSGGGQTSIAIGTIDALERGGVVRSSAQQEMTELYIDSCSYLTTEENFMRGRI